MNVSNYVVCPKNYTIDLIISLNINDFYFFIFESFFIFTLIILLLFGVFFTNNKAINNNYYVINNAIINILYFLFVVFMVLLYNNHNGNYTIFANYYTSNIFIFYLKLSLLLFSFFFFPLLKQYSKKANKSWDFEFIIIILFSIFGLICVFSSNDFLVSYLMLELQTLSLYILVSFKQTSSLSTEAGLKYFILGSFSSGLLLFGISLVYGFSGLLNFEDMYIFASALSYNTTGTSIKLLSIESGFLLGLLFILVSLLFKLGIAPFHI
jgi:NADH-quinone oxidoreductase subunit N